MKLWCWFFVVVLAGCAQEKEKSTKKYFDFDRLLDGQIAILSSEQRNLVKTAVLNGTSQDTVFRPSKKDWARELEAFRLLETINKPAFLRSYTVEEAVEDSRSNLKIHQFKLDSSHANDSRIEFVKLYYHNDLSELKKIECSIVQKNLLYSNHDELAMTFDDEGGKAVITGYAMSGYQKMLLGDTVRFSVRGIIEQGLK
jgi:hypothetical protein